MIPARYQSTRLPGKLLLEIGGKPMILHTAARASMAGCASRVLVATDDRRIADTAEKAGFEAVMTSPDHQTGSDRIVEAVETIPDDAIIINVQGDEPMIAPATIDAAFDVLVSDADASMSTTCERISDVRDVLSPDVVKVVVDANGNALYFSRSPIPFPRDTVKKHGGVNEALEAEPELLARFRKHTGLYAYRCSELRRFARLPVSGLESCEMLEQLRALENGFRIKVAEAAESSIGVDTSDDLERVRELFAAEQI